MEQNVNVSFKFFDEALVQRVIAFTEQAEARKADAKALSDEIRGIYAEKDATLKAQTQEQLVTLKKTHREKLAQLDKDLERDLAAAMAKDTDPKELHNIRFGLETVCKRAKIKERGSYNDEIKELKMQRVFLHEEYTRLIYNVTGVVSPMESLRNKALETYASFNLKATLTNKQFYVGLVPLCMLMLIIAAYFIGKSITGYTYENGQVTINASKIDGDVVIKAAAIQPTLTYKLT
ncbi:MAG: hypothetical protein IJA71_01305, partial [Clostridia bacterium]|nr:hypothetical protein [Clostridia bacterium]